MKNGRLATDTACRFFEFLFKSELELDDVESFLMKNYQRLPVAFSSGHGAWLRDENGKEYLDALAGIAVCGLGHAHPAVTKALSQQAASLLHTSNLYQVPLQEELGQRLCQLAGMDKVFFANSGAEANEAAIKLCRLHANEQGLKQAVIVVMEGSFHGRTLATLSATGNVKVKQGFAPLVEGFHQIPYDDLDALKQLTDSDKDIIAVMLEPIQGEGGIVVPKPGYLQAVREICTENGWLMVLDEIQTGMCRSGRWFACQHEQVQPDIMTLAKALGNGVPIGACLATDSAARLMVPGKHGSTFGGNPLASAASLAVIDTLKSLSLEQRAAELGETMLSGFKQTLSGLKDVKNIRGKGLLIGIELQRDCGELVSQALQQGMLINVTAGNVVRLLPPLIISDEEAEQIVVKVSQLIKDFLSSV